MDVREIGYEVLRELFLEYQETQNPVIFNQILARVDLLLLNQVWKLSSTWPYLHDVELEELYQSAVIGLYKAVMSLPKEESVRFIPARIVGYVKDQFRKYKKPSRERLKCRSLDPNSVGQFGENSLPGESVYRLPNSADVRVIFEQIVKEGVVSKEELQFLYFRYADGESIASIARRLDLKEQFVRRSVASAFLRLRHQLRMRSITMEG